MTVETVQVPAYRPFAVQVAPPAQLSPSSCAAFTGPDLDHFASNGLDQRIRSCSPCRAGAWSTARPAPTGTASGVPSRPRGRCRSAYTVRALRRDPVEVDVDFVLHGATGPASAWAERPPSVTRSCWSARTRCSRARPAGSVAPAGGRDLSARRRRRDRVTDLRDRPESLPTTSAIYWVKPRWRYSPTPRTASRSPGAPPWATGAAVPTLHGHLLTAVIATVTLVAPPRRGPAALLDDVDVVDILEVPEDDRHLRRRS